MVVLVKPLVSQYFSFLSLISILAEDHNDLDEREHSPRDLNEISGEGNMENMLLVEQGLRELALLKVFS